MTIRQAFAPVIIMLLLQIPTSSRAQMKKYADVRVGASQLSTYLPLIKDKKVAIVMNQTSMLGDALLLDTLIALGVQVTKIFVPEHGFRGTADAGAHIKSELDAETGLPILSLYGNNKKPSAAQLANVDVVLYDLQDVGVRFYTYISTLEYVMDACNENKKTIIVLDRPNPNGHLIDGPVLDSSLRSFVGMQKIPVVYGMTAGEYAQMLVGERWIKNAKQLKLTVIPCAQYTHKRRYNLPVAPSPNLGNMAAVYLYPSLCFFEGTVVSVGRGTNYPFQQWGHPSFAGKASYAFVPQSKGGASKPLLEGQSCYGMLISTNADTAYKITSKEMNLSYLLHAYQWSTNKDKFFNSFFEKLAGTTLLRKQIIAGKTEEEIRASWQPELQKFKTIRSKYLLYED
ncbi:MAG: DUF1343 domain-containing protein [Chitinophagaceae bacterium]|nr:DUF1343 domain-containing protein [Chitinophagaceae bacterium]